MSTLLHVIEVIADVIDALAVVLLVVGLLVVLGAALRRLAVRAKAGPGVLAAAGDIIRDVRGGLGQILLLALEILIISDILHSIVHRTLEELALLGGTVAIRIALAYFLDREIRGLDKSTPAKG